MFTREELETISDAIIERIAACGEARRIVAPDKDSVAAISKQMNGLQALNHKVCEYIMELRTGGTEK